MNKNVRASVGEKPGKCNDATPFNDLNHRLKDSDFSGDRCDRDPDGGGWRRPKDWDLINGFSR